MVLNEEAKYPPKEVGLGFENQYHLVMNGLIIIIIGFHNGDIELQLKYRI